VMGMGTSLVVMREVWGANLGNALVGDEMRAWLYIVLRAVCDLSHLGK